MDALPPSAQVELPVLIKPVGWFNSSMEDTKILYYYFLNKRITK